MEMQIAFALMAFFKFYFSPPKFHFINQWWGFAHPQLLPSPSWVLIKVFASLMPGNRGAEGPQQGWVSADRGNIPCELRQCCLSPKRRLQALEQPDAVSQAGCKAGGA